MKVKIIWVSNQEKDNVVDTVNKYQKLYPEKRVTGKNFGSNTTEIHIQEPL